MWHLQFSACCICPYDCNASLRDLPQLRLVKSLLQESGCVSTKPAGRYHKLMASMSRFI